MARLLSTLPLAGLAALVAAPAWAGPAHVLSSHALSPAVADAGYAVSPTLDPATRKALSKGLAEAGLRVTPVEQPHAYLVTVSARTGALCTRSCSQQVLHDDSNLDDYYRHEAVVVATANAGASVDATGPVAWYTVLQSDGLSNRRGDYLPALLRYGARAYGRTTASEAPPHLSPPLTLLPPNVSASPGS